MSTTEPALSIVVPVYESAPFLAASLGELSEYVAALDAPSEVVVVDDGSHDDSGAITETCRRSWPSRSELCLLTHPENRGKGAAVRTGMLAARGRHRVFTDADLAYGLAPVARLRAVLDAGADVAAGTRDQHRGLLRRTAGRVFTRIVATGGLVRARDPQCGLKAFRAAAADRLFSLSVVDDFAFDVEILHLASRCGMDVRYVPVEERSGERVSSVRLLRDAPRMLRSLRRIRRLSESGGYTTRPEPASTPRRSALDS